MRKNIGWYVVGIIIVLLLGYNEYEKSLPEYKCDIAEYGIVKVNEKTCKKAKQIYIELDSLRKQNSLVYKLYQKYDPENKKYIPKEYAPLFKSGGNEVIYQMGIREAQLENLVRKKAVFWFDK